MQPCIGSPQCRSPIPAPSPPRAEAKRGRKEHETASEPSRMKKRADMRALPRRERNGQRPATSGVAQSRSTRRGAAAVEAAIVMNIFLLFIFAIMEFGHFVMVKQLMDIAAR